MLIIMKIILMTMFSLFMSIFIGIFLIPYLKKKKKEQTLSVYLEERHKSKAHIPTMGGLIFIVPPVSLLVLLLILGKIPFTYNLFIILLTFIGYSFIGLLDDYLIIKRHNNQGLSESMKLILQIILAIILFYFFLKGGNEPLIWIHTLNIKINIGWLYGLFILLVLTSSSNAVNLTDGLDGLAGGLSLIAFFTQGIITLNTGWLEGYIEITLFIFALVGSLMGFLMFNSYPAKIFMGDTGSLALGSTLGMIAILTRHELLLIVIGIVFVLETLSCLIQRGYYKMTHKRVFPMTPIHHTFEQKLPENEVVKLFWLIGLIGSLVSLLFGVWI